MTVVHYEAFGDIRQLFFLFVTLRQIPWESALWGRRVVMFGKLLFVLYMQGMRNHGEHMYASTRAVKRTA
jgi:hypothetical protein